MDFWAQTKIHKGAVNVVKENELCQTLHQTNSKATKASTSSIACGCHSAQDFFKRDDVRGETVF